MANYIIRLDDACPQMNVEKWERIESILDKYGIEPIVGIIPDNKDPDFIYGNDNAFWEKCLNWQNKNWTIAIHGLNHLLIKHEPRGYYQKSHSIKTEWAGLPVDRQFQMVVNGFEILSSHGLNPSCFFAPCHTYDVKTIKAISLFNKMYKALYISDGYNLRPYKEDGVWFLPSIFDSPHAFNGNIILTFVFHPNNMENDSFLKLESFLRDNEKYFVNADYVMNYFMEKGEKKRGIIGKCIESIIYYIRLLRKIIK